MFIISPYSRWSCGCWPALCVHLTECTWHHTKFMPIQKHLYIPQNHYNYLAHRHKTFFHPGRLFPTRTSLPSCTSRTQCTPDSHQNCDRYKCSKSKSEIQKWRNKEQLCRAFQIRTFLFTFLDITLTRGYARLRPTGEMKSKTEMKRKLFARKTKRNQKYAKMTLLWATAGAARQWNEKS